MKKNTLDWVVWVLVVLGALNWGFVGFFNYNLLEALLGGPSTGLNVVYDLVGLSSLYLIFTTLVKK